MTYFLSIEFSEWEKLKGTLKEQISKMMMKSYPKDALKIIFSEITDVDTDNNMTIYVKAMSNEEDQYIIERKNHPVFKDDF